MYPHTERLSNRYKYVFIGILLICYNTIFAQHEADNWILNRRVGLSFSSSEPTVISGTQLNYYNCPASISDRHTGQLLFYSDGLTVWDKENTIMPNGKNLKGSKLGTQSTLAIPRPSRNDLYYIFSLAEKGDENANNNYGLHYSVVDMSLRDGNGDVDPQFKNVLLEKEVNNKLTAVSHSNGRDYWIIAHGLNTDEFLVYLASPQGINLSRRISVGPTHSTQDRGDSGLSGTMKASPDGKHLACITTYLKDSELGRLEFYDFDNTTGIISNYKNLGDKYWIPVSTCFSPNNTKLYLTGYDYPGMKSCQFDLKDPQFGSTKYEPIPIQIFKKWGQDSALANIDGDLQLAPNGKIYGIINEGVFGGQAFNQMMVIDDPDSLGLDCKPHLINLEFGEGTRLTGFFPNFVTGVFNKSVDTIPSYEHKEFSCGYDLLLYPNPISKDWLTIEMDPGQWRKACFLRNLKVYDTRGILLFERTDINDTFKVNTSTWPSGVYVFVFDYSDSQGKRIGSVSKKVIVQ